MLFQMFYFIKFKFKLQFVAILSQNFSSGVLTWS